jgi:hypothetical protein
MHEEDYEGLEGEYSMTRLPCSRLDPQKHRHKTWFFDVLGVAKKATGTRRKISICTDHPSYKRKFVTSALFLRKHVDMLAIEKTALFRLAYIQRKFSKCCISMDLSCFSKLLYISTPIRITKLCTGRIYIAELNRNALLSVSTSGYSSSRILTFLVLISVIIIQNIALVPRLSRYHGLMHTISEVRILG